MISIKSEREIELMRIAGSIVGDTHKYLQKYTFIQGDILMRKVTF